MRILLWSAGSQDSCLSRQKPGGNRLKAKQAKVNQRVLAHDELLEDSCPLKHNNSAARLVGPQTAVSHGLLAIFHICDRFVE